MQQLSLFATGRRPPVRIAIDPNGPVIQGEVDAVYRLPHPRLAWDHARIELQRHEDGLWMWSASWHADMCGVGYRVGPKWGKFAESREDALFYAACEIEERLRGTPGREAALILKWVEAMKDGVPTA